MPKWPSDSPNELDLYVDFEDDHYTLELTIDEVAGLFHCSATMYKTTSHDEMVEGDSEDSLEKAQQMCVSLAHKVISKRLKRVEGEREAMKTFLARLPHV